MERKLCVNCLEHTRVEMLTISTRKELQGEIITFDAKSYKCLKCEKLIPNNDLDNGNFEILYRKFREKKHMLQPEEIKYIREKIYQVNIRFLAKLIGCSPATLSRYENGALQSKQHDNQLKMLKDPKNMKIIFESNFDDIPEGKDKHELKERLDFLLDVVKGSDILKGFDDNLYLLDIQAGEIEEWTLASTEEVEKFFIIKGQELDKDDLRISPLKLQKLLYYAQGWTTAFTENQLFDSEFQAWVHGPVIPDVYHKYKKFRYDQISINKDSLIYNLDLTSTQFKILEWVWDKYSKFTAEFLEDLTHMESPWRNTRADLPSDALCDWEINRKEIEAYFSSRVNTLKLLQKL